MHSFKKDYCHTLYTLYALR
uniref:Uncharacterized protein n=1 Tax=Arundo donax TaxID=35708 RepID=A0A0A9A1I7_ARUDO